MRAPETVIKQAILHPHREVRTAAMRYFSSSHSRDPEILPLVIEAVEKHGLDRAFHFGEFAENLIHTEATINWTIGWLLGNRDGQAAGAGRGRGVRSAANS